MRSRAGLRTRPRRRASSAACRTAFPPLLAARWHHHDEHRAALDHQHVRARCQGDWIGQFRAGQLVLTGPRPHNWVTMDMPGRRPTARFAIHHARGPAAEKPSRAARGARPRLGARHGIEFLACPGAEQHWYRASRRARACTALARFVTMTRSAATTTGCSSNAKRRRRPR